jgi:hypothetical protein
VVGAAAQDGIVTAHPGGLAELVRLVGPSSAASSCSSVLPADVSSRSNRSMMLWL